MKSTTQYLLDDERWLDGNAETEAVEEIAVLLRQLDEVADACMEVQLRTLHLPRREVPACFEDPEVY